MDEDTKADAVADDLLFEVPEGTADTGRYSVYDRELGRYVGGVTADKPTLAEARKIGGKHAAVVEV